MPEIAVVQLPGEARETLQLIRKCGPFPYERDGVPFGNFERLLPARERGYYREYTVPTPGVKSRGARRIVRGCAPDPDSRNVEREGARGAASSRERTGSTSTHSGSDRGIPCSAGGELYYTDDHYRSFRRIRETQ